MRHFWLNLPVRDITKSKAFFNAIGFNIDTQFGNSATSASMLLGENKVRIMLFEQKEFEGFAQTQMFDTAVGAEVLLSIDADTKEAVDEMARKAVAAGGVSTHVPHEMKGWMYGCLFIDIDGHRWNVLYMDMSKMPKVS